MPQLVYSTYFGGKWRNDHAYAVAADQDGNAYLTGFTSSSHFPLVNALYQTQGSNIFVSKIGYDAGLNKMSLLYSTYLGKSSGSADGWGSSIIVDGKHNAYVAGCAGKLPMIHNVSSPGSGVMVFKINDGGGTMPWQCCC